MPFVIPRTVGIVGSHEHCLAKSMSFRACILVDLPTVVHICTTWKINGTEYATIVSMEFPKVDVRFQDLRRDAFVHVGSRALPIIPNFICNMTFFSFFFFNMQHD